MHLYLTNKFDEALQYNYLLCFIRQLYGRMVSFCPLKYLKLKLQFQLNFCMVRLRSLTLGVI
jgi:hypothetical protein